MNTEVMVADTSREDRLWGALAHLSAIFGFLVSAVVFIPFGFIFGPLVIWYWKKNTSEFVEDQGKEAINFQITMLLWFLLCWILKLVLIGFFLSFIVAIINVAMATRAGSKAYDGERYRYPMTLRLFR